MDCVLVTFATELLNYSVAYSVGFELLIFATVLVKYSVTYSVGSVLSIFATVLETYFLADFFAGFG